MTNNLFDGDPVVSGGNMGIVAGSSSAPTCSAISLGISYGVNTQSPLLNDGRPSSVLHTQTITSQLIASVAGNSGVSL